MRRMPTSNKLYFVSATLDKQKREYWQIGEHFGITVMVMPSYEVRPFVSVGTQSIGMKFRKNKLCMSGS